MKRILLLLGSLLIHQLSIGQECGTHATAEQLKFMESFDDKVSLNSRTEAVDIQIPIMFHSVTRDDGTGGLTPVQAEGILNNLNNFYSNSSIQFFLNDDVNYIANSDQFDFDASAEGSVAVGNDVGGVINIYFFNTIVLGGSGLCGYTRFPPSSDRIFVAYSCVIGETTLEHEIGHYFTLFHTHGTTNTGTTDELVNGTNCSSAGDRICDTPADPNLTGNVTNCIYTGTAKDANGDFYKPDVSNIMAYAPDQCQNKFSQGQYDRIRSGFENGRIYLNWISDDFSANFIADNRELCLGSSVQFNGVGSLSVTTWFWEFPGGTPSTSNLQNPIVTYSNSGGYAVKLTASDNSGNSLEVVKNSYINVINPLDGAVTDTLDYAFSNSLDDFKILNSDLAFTFEKSDADFENSPNSGSITVNNFEYLSEVPGNEDFLITKTLNTVGARKYQISFDYAYAARPIIEKDIIVYDSLSLLFNTGCLSNDVVLWARGGNQLSSATPREDMFIPNQQVNWRHAELEYNLTSEESAIFKFKNVSYNGNNVYIDNFKITPDLSLNPPTFFRIVDYVNGILTIRWVDNAINELNYVLERSVNDGDYQSIVIDKNVQLYQDSDIEQGNSYKYRLFALGRAGVISEKVGELNFDNAITSINHLVSDEMSIEVYPNPASNYLEVKAGANIINSIRISDMHGRHILDVWVNSNSMHINLNGYKRGLYLITAKSNKGILTKKIILE